jgi:hypothetical protein
MRPLWEHSDDAIRFTSSSICALLAKQVVRGVVEEQQLRWLHEVTKETPRAIRDANMATRDRMIFKFFVSRVSTLFVVPTESSLKETLAILLDVENDAHFDTNLRDWLVEWIQRQDLNESRQIIDKLRSMFPNLLPTAIFSPSATGSGG